MQNQDLIFLLDEAILDSKFKPIDFRKLQNMIGNLPVKTIIKTFWKENIIVVLPEVVSCHIWLDGFFEKDLTKFILEHIKSDMVFIDIGAHIGYFSLLAAKLVGSNGYVYSFEPTKNTFQILQENCLNKKNIVLNNKAVFSKNGSIEINDYGTKWSAFNSIFEPRISKILSKIKAQKINVEIITLDQYCKNKNIKPNFIKIDAEKSEFKILIGAKKTIKKYHPIISCETDNENETKQLVDFMQNKNYTCDKIIDGNIIFM